MNITRNAQIAGIPGKDARDYVRQVLRFTQGNGGLSAARLPLPRGHKTNVGLLQRLQMEGFLSLNVVDKTWSVTNKGVQLAGARIGNRIPHNQALDLVVEIVKRADELNSYDQLLVEVRSIHAFGSVVSPAALDHGDVDIGFTYCDNDSKWQTYRALDAQAQDSVIADFCARMDISPDVTRKNGFTEDLGSIQRRWIKRELSLVSRFVSVADFSDVGMKHITGPNHIVFFSHRDDSGKNYRQWRATNRDDIMQNLVYSAIASSGAFFAVEANRAIWGIEERWDAARQTP